MSDFKNTGFVSNTVIKDMRNAERISALKLLNCDEKYTDGRASDFEWFDRWERDVLLAAGHREAKKYAEGIAAASLAPRTALNCSREESIARWRLWNTQNNTGVFEGDRVSKTEEKGDGEATKIVPKNDETAIFNIDKYVSDITIKHDSLSALSTYISEEALDGEKPCITLVVGLNGGEYKRPDPYLAEGIFQRKKRGEKLNLQEENLLASQLLIELIFALRDVKKLSLIIRKNGENEAAIGLVKYLYRRRIFEGEIRLSADEGTDFCGFAEAALEVYPRIRLRPLVDMGADKPSASWLTDTFFVYPVGAFCFENAEKSKVLATAFEAVADSPAHAELLRKITII